MLPSDPEHPWLGENGTWDPNMGSMELHKALSSPPETLPMSASGRRTLMVE